MSREEDNKKSGKKRFWLYLIVPPAAIIVFLLLLEAGERVYCSFHFRTPRYLIYPLLEKSAFQLPPAHRVASTVQDQSEDGYYKSPSSSYTEENDITINSLGFRGQEFLPEKSEGVIRVFCTGGSQTFSSECKNGESYPEALEEMLNRQEAGSGSVHQVINAGFSGYKTRNILNLVNRELLSYQPDVITVCEAFTDVGRHSLVLDSQIKQTFWSIHMFLFQKSLLYSDIILKIARRGYVTANMAGEASKSIVNYAGNLRAIARSIKAAGVNPVFVLQPILHPDMGKKNLYKGLSGVDIDALLESEYLFAFSRLHNVYLDIMTKVAREENVLLIDPLPAFENHAAPQDLFTYYMHFSAAGSRVMAEEIYQGIVNSGLLGQ